MYDRYGSLYQMNVTKGTAPGLSASVDGTTNRFQAPYTYDEAGNMTGDGTHTYQWDGEGRLAKADNGSTATFASNALGQWVYWQTGNSPQYVYDVWGQDVGGVQVSAWRI